MARRTVSARGPAVSAARRSFAAVGVFDSLDEVREAWQRLQATATISPYQTLAWASAWLETEGHALGARARIAVAADERGQPVALLPFCLLRRGPLNVLGFIGGRHANYNLGLFDPGTAWTPAEVRRLLREVASEACRIDVFALQNQPLAWGGWLNPMASIAHQKSPSDSHRAVLGPDADDFLRRHQSAAARKKLRSKQKQLSTLGPVVHMIARTPREIEAVLDAYRTQKAAKLTTIGVAHAALDRSHRLYARAAHGPSPALELHALRCGERIVATLGGLVHRDRFSGQMISHDADPVFARLSPGEILLTAVIASQCAAGRAGFDLGIGESRYKESLCPIADPLIDSLVPISAAGHLYVAAEALRLRLKGAIKRSSMAWALALALRRRVAALRRRR